MRIHTDRLTESDIYTAARHARADVVVLTEHGSRSRDHAFNVKLEGESRRRPNGGASGKGYASGYAATWDQWGVFLAILFDIDPDAFTPYDKSGAYFDQRTNWRFRPTVVGLGESTNYHVVNVVADPPYHTLGSSYWPDDAHGDHRFEFAGVPREQACRKCSAVQRW